MDNEELKRRLTATFAEEGQERARALERDLLALEISEAAERTELIRSLFRHAHSLKGAAGLVEMRSIESACHYMEELFGAAQGGQLALDHAAIELLLKVTDAIADTARRLSDGDPQPGRLADLAPQLVSMVTGMSARPAPQNAQDRMLSLNQEQHGPTEPDADDPSDRYSRHRSIVRVPAERLDALLSHSGELMAARYRSRARMDQTTALQELTKGPSRQRSVGKTTSSSISEPGVEQSSFRTTSFIQTGRTERDRDVLLQLQDGLQQLGTDLANDHRTFDKAATALDVQLRQARMQPFSQACDGLDRVVRDLGQSLGKSARLDIKGGEVGVDRSIVERLRDVLRHLVRNAVDHGLEPVRDRIAAGKEKVGRITVAAILQGDRVQVSVADDGRGLDAESIREQLRKKGIAVAGDEREIVLSIFLPSFSTSSNVTQVSGRGVGLDVVKSTVEDMRGVVDVVHLPSRGATFTLTLPLTLTTVRALLLSTSGKIFAIDTTSVNRLIRCSKEDIQSIEGQPVILSSNGPMAVLELSDWLGLPLGVNRRGAAKFPAIILNIAGREVAILVEEVLAEQDLVVRGLGPRLSGIRRYIAGSILSDGRVALVLNATRLAEGAIEQRPQREQMSFIGQPQEASQRRVLVADDSVTIRTLQKSILEAAGYEVTVASDGAEAWQILQRQGADVVVSDVEMPRMDGFNLIEAMRGSERFKATPVVLLTARETEQDKARGLQLGADAYLLKSTFDQRQLLDTIAQLV